MGLTFFENSSRPLALTVSCTLSLGTGAVSRPWTLTFFSRSTRFGLPLTSTLMPVADAPAPGFFAACAAPASSARSTVAAREQRHTCHWGSQRRHCGR